MFYKIHKTLHEAVDINDQNQKSPRCPEKNDILTADPNSYSFLGFKNYS